MSSAVGVMLFTSTSCVVEDIRDGKDEVIDELVATLQKLMK